MWAYDRGNICNEDGDVLAHVPYTLGDEFDQAPGRLMAAAPELLAACQDAAEWLLHMNTPASVILARLRVAIESAK